MVIYVNDWSNFSPGYVMSLEEKRSITENYEFPPHIVSSERDSSELEKKSED